jgi:hypothetical protein
VGVVTIADELKQLVTLARQAIGVYGRPDLAERIDAAVASTQHDRCRVLVVGNFKTGKSSLVNGLVNAPACPADDDIATAVPTIITFGAEPAARGHLGGDDAGMIELPLDRIHDAIQARWRPAEADGADVDDFDLRAIEIAIPRRILQGGLDLVDTPGVGGITSLHQAATLSTLPTADAVLFVSDAARSYTAREVDFIASITAANPIVAAVVTKVDFYPHWRRIVADNEGQLRTVARDAPIFPVATPIRSAAISANDAEMNLESGYADLVAWLQNVATNRSAITAASVARSLHHVFDQLHAQLRLREAALADPVATAASSAALERAEAAVTNLRSASSGWATKLNDGIADMAAEVDHDLRERLRSRLRNAEKRLADIDPASAWPDFETWLTEGVAVDIGANVEVFRQQSENVLTTVGELFEDAAGAAATALPSHQLAVEVDDPDFSKRSLMGTGLTALRGSYGGMLMFGMLANVAGVALLAPAAPVLGLFLGRKVMRDERERSLAQRRQQALQATRQYIDGVSGQVNKDTRSAVRRVQRDLRAHFQDEAAQLQASVAASLAAARADHLDDSERARQLDALRGDLVRLEEYLDRADGVVTRALRSLP